MEKIPWWFPKIEKEDYEFITQALDANFVNEGPLTEKFENEIKARIGVKHVFATTSGTSAIFLALKAMGIKQGDEVIVPDLTFIATANAVDLTGAKPILVDVEPNRLTINIEAIKKALTSKTKAIIPVHVTGRAADMESILEIAKHYNLAIVEDAAEALMSKHKNKFLGTWGDVGCFSFSANKTISTGQGGVLVTNSDDTALHIRPLKDQGRPKRGTGGNDLHDTIGYNFRYTDLQAGMGLGQLKHLDERMVRMKRNFELYRNNLKNVPEIMIYPTDLENGEVPQWTDIKTERRDELEVYLKKINIDCRKYWFPIHRQKAYALPDNLFPNAIHASAQSLWLPSAFTLTDKDIEKVSSAIKEFFNKN